MSLPPESEVGENTSLSLITSCISILPCTEGRETVREGAGEDSSAMLEVGEIGTEPAWDEHLCMSMYSNSICWTLTLSYP